MMKRRRQQLRLHSDHSEEAPFHMNTLHSNPLQRTRYARNEIEPWSVAKKGPIIQNLKTTRLFLEIRINDTYESILTSRSVRLTEMRSEAMRLNWLILNCSFIFTCCASGMTTACPISPGAVAARGFSTETNKHVIKRGN